MKNVSEIKAIKIEKCLLFLLFIVVIVHPITGQQNLDSLRNILSIANISSSEKALTANLLSSIYISNSADSAKVYNDLAIKYATTAKNKRELAFAEIMRGSLNTTVWSLDSIENHFFDLLEQKTVKVDRKLLAMLYTDIGKMYNERGMFEKAAENSLIALEYNTQLGNENEIGKINYNLGVIYYSSSQYDLAIEKFKKAAKSFGKLENEIFQAYCYNGIANIYINTVELDSALVYSELLKSIADKSKNTGLQAISRTAIGSIFAEQEEYKQALDIYAEALPYLEGFGNIVMLASCFCNIGAAHYKLENYQRAITNLNKAYSFDIFKDNSIADDLCLKTIALTQEKLGNYKDASKYYNQYVEYQDSVLIKENKLVVAELEEKYEASKKDAEILAQQTKINQKTYERNILLGGLGLSVLLGCSLIWGLFSRNKRDKKIAIQEQDLNQQKIQTLEKEKKLLSMSSLLEGQENERIRIAKDLHDGLGGLLTTVKAHFGQIQSEIEKVENLDIYKTANQMIDKAYDEVRRISHNLMPADLRVGGLPVAIRQLVHELRTIHEINSDLELIGFNNVRLEEKIELSTYRIVQELINNIIKYADSTQVFVQVSKFENELQVVVEDNGVGFNYQEELSKGDGLGLKSIHSRVSQLNGDMDVVTASGKGTSVTINVPI
jgi:signal transduction histidine kinase/ribosomal protein L20